MIELKIVIPILSPLYNLDVFCYMIWTVFIIQFGRILLYDLDGLYFLINNISILL